LGGSGFDEAGRIHNVLVGFGKVPQQETRRAEE